MSTADVANQAVDRDFEKWCRAVELEADQELIQGRFSAANDLISSISEDDIEPLLRIVFETKFKCPSEALGKFSAFFAAYDDTFNEQDNLRELQVLVGAALALSLKRTSNISALIALSILTTDFGGQRQLRVSIPLVGLAGQALKRMADERRIRPELGPSASPPITLDFESAKAKAKENTFESVSVALELVTKSISKAVQDLQKQETATRTKIHNFIRVQDEELQILWWLYGNRSTDLSIPFSEIPTVQRPLVLAKELSEATQIIPGPLSASAMLVRAGLSENTSLMVPDAVNSFDTGWLQQLDVDRHISDLTVPIHGGVFRYLESGDSKAWVSSWTAVAGIAPDFRLPETALSLLFYYERLLMLFGSGVTRVH